jgi:hypothetical protein
MYLLERSEEIHLGWMAIGATTGIIAWLGDISVAWLAIPRNLGEPSPVLLAPWTVLQRKCWCLRITKENNYFEIGYAMLILPS